MQTLHHHKPPESLVKQAEIYLADCEEDAKDLRSLYLQATCDFPSVLLNDSLFQCDPDFLRSANPPEDSPEEDTTIQHENKLLEGKVRIFNGSDHS